MRFACLFLAASALFIFGVARPAAGVQQFLDAFVATYIKDHPNKEFQDHVKNEAKCWVCHQGKNRKNRNVFGNELDKMLDRKTDAKDTAKIVDALKKAMDMHVDAKNDKSETYADRVKAGKLPAGTLDDLKKEPEKKEEEKK
jgi:cytochrome c2